MLALVLFAAGCQRVELDESLPVAVNVVTIAREDLAREMRYSATVKELQKVDLSFKVPGTIRELYQVLGVDGQDRDVQTGDHVAQGATIARLDDADYRRRWEIAKQQLAQAESQLAGAKANAEAAARSHARFWTLYQDNVVPQEQMDAALSRRDSTQAAAAAAQREVQAARIAAQQAEDDLANCALVVPAMGDVTVSEKFVERNERVMANQRAFLLIDVSRVRVAFGVPDSLVGTLTLGQSLTVTCEALGGRRFAGRVSKIAAAADPATRTFLAEVTIDQPERLRPGMIVTVSLGGRSEGMLLPMTAIQRGATPNDFVVYQVVKEQKQQVARRRTVELGGVYNNRIQIVAGPRTQVGTGDTIVASGASRLVEGQAVRVLGEERLAPEI